MRVRRLDDIPGFNLDWVAEAAGDDPDVLRMENLDMDIPPIRRANHSPGVAVHIAPRQ